MSRIQERPETDAFLLEREHFSKTLQTVMEERRKAEADLGVEEGNDRFIQVIDDGSDDSIVQQFLLRMKLRSLHQLRLSEKAPYFARLDFTPDSEQASALPPGSVHGEPIYLGRWGVIKTPEYKICVADWRSPVANLYYSGQIGQVSYDAPDGPVHGMLTLKRLFSVDDGKLLSMQDTGVIGQEQYLTDALSQVTTARLREVVTTIQAEQNLVIRHDPFQPLFVQGTAGSGKTTIALHRIAWILYRLQKTLIPSQLLILAPSPLFLSYISRVLPDLGVGEVRQMTFPELCQRLLGKRMPRLCKAAGLENRLSMTKARRDALDSVLRQKGSLALGQALERFLSVLEKSMFPKEDINFGGRTLLSAMEMQHLCLHQLRHFPLESRVGEARKVVISRLKKLSGEVNESIHHTVKIKMEGLLRTLPEGEDRQQRVARLLHGRDERIAQWKEAEKAFWAAYDQNWKPLDLLTVYNSFWEDLVAREPVYANAFVATKPMLEKKQAAPEDLPALLWLGERLYGLSRMDIRHVVIDEAQDVSPLQVKILRQIFRHDAFTLVGDLWQGVFGDAGLRSWDDLRQGVFETAPDIVTLSVSYRSTLEIMRFAFRAMARHPVAGVAPGQPVLRHGETPQITMLKQWKDQPKVIADILQGWQREGFFSMAVLVKEEASARKLYKALYPLLPEVRLVSPGDSAFEGGMMVMGASLVKGLEFDCVLIADADAANYPDERFYAKLFYVLCTRPLHRLRLLYIGDSPGATLLALPANP